MGEQRGKGVPVGQLIRDGEKAEKIVGGQGGG